jgi:glycosyltransferase involved in cell wall biosynthesis
VDDGSTDDSARIATGFEEVVVLHQENAGPAAARNRGIAAATGSHFAFIDSDDLWTPGKLAHQVGHLRDHPEDILTIGMFRYFTEPGREVPGSFNRDLLGRDLVGRLLSTLVARREAFERIGGFDPALRTGEDVDWFARAKDLGVPTAVLPHVLLEKRVHDRNTSADAANTARLLEVLGRSIRRKRESPGKEGSDR